MCLTSWYRFSLSSWHSRLLNRHKFVCFIQTAKQTRNFSVYQHYGSLKYDTVEFCSFGVISCFSLQGMRLKNSNLTIFRAPTDDG